MDLLRCSYPGMFDRLTTRSCIDISRLGQLAFVGDIDQQMQDLVTLSQRWAVQLSSSVTAYVIAT